MIGKVLDFLRQHLNAYFKAQADLATPGPDSPPQGDKVVFVDGEQVDSIQFKVNAVSLLLINVEEERTLRAPDPHARLAPDGSRIKIQPDIRMNLYLLFVARFKSCSEAWSQLSHIIQYFQAYRVLDHNNAPDLHSEIDRLSMELVTLDFAAQNEVWNALRATYQPSILYKVQLVVFRDPRVQPSRRVSEADRGVAEESRAAGVSP